MCWLDEQLIREFGRCATDGGTLAGLVHLIAGSDLIKGGVFAVLFYGLWFGAEKRADATARRERLLATLAAALVAAFLTRGLAALLPERALAAALALPGGGHVALPPALADSFPSDHAGLFLALSVGLLALSRRLGVAAVLYSFAVVLLPRLYTCRHVLSDVLVGAAIGAALGGLFQARFVRDRFAPRLLAFAAAHPGAFHAALFFCLFQVAVLFMPLRELAGAARALLAGGAP